MILALTLSPSIDRFGTANSLGLHEINRLEIAGSVPGGKALNAARAAKTYGANVEVIAPLGGFSGNWIESATSALEIEIIRVAISATSRICTAILSSEDQTLTQFYEEAPPLSTDEFSRFAEEVSKRLDNANWCLVSGSIPEQTDKVMIRELLDTVAKSRCKVAIDLAGENLYRALHARPDLVKVNLFEAQEVVALLFQNSEFIRALGGITLDLQVEDEISKAASLATLIQKYLVTESKNQKADSTDARGAAQPFPKVVVTVGQEGAIYRSDKTWIARNHLHGNFPVGSGDTLMGVMLACLDLESASLDESNWLAAFGEGVGASVANSLEPLPALFTKSKAQECLKKLEIVQL